tara:strand:+ start:438 stop:926 length:489 start_codon:yes stop_codon:yes gene_type:complete
MRSATPVGNPVNLPDFAARVCQQIPLLAAMQVDFIHYSGDALSLGMPLAPNINDKQTGFGGSIAALATACGWALISLALKEESLNVDVMVIKSEMHYLAPVTGDCQARGEMSPVERMHMLQQMTTKGRVKKELVLEVYLGEARVATCKAKYLAKLVQEQPSV